MKTDAQIQKDVIDELRWAPFISSNEIGVTVKDGIVTLSGTVDTYAKKTAAENATKKVVGVRAVAEDIEVKLNHGGERTDADIAETVLNALKWHSVVPEEKIKVKVDNAWVTLDGTVEWDFQRKSAKNAISNLLGVRGITNNISVLPVIPIDAAKVKTSISSAFHRTAAIDAEKINVEIVGSKVILKGNVKSWNEKDEATNAAWSIPGVSSVENKLEIESAVFTF